MYKMISRARKVLIKIPTFPARTRARPARARKKILRDHPSALKSQKMGANLTHAN